MGTQYDVFERSIVAIPIIRYAEVLLNYAEAKAELGILIQADIDKSLKLIRDRAGLPDLNFAQVNQKPDAYKSGLYPNVTGRNKGAILKIRREQRVELAMEGFRWNDIFRWKTGSTLVSQFKGMHFPGLGNDDLDHDGKTDVCLYQGDKPDTGKDVQYLKVRSDVVLEVCLYLRF